MNRIALAYGITGLAVAIAVATVLASFAGSSDERELVADDAPAATTLPVDAPLATSPVAEEITYVDEAGNPVDPRQLRRAARRRAHDDDDSRDDDSRDDDDGERHERRRHDDDEDERGDD